MSEPVIQANKNLLRNGDFSQALKEWTSNNTGFRAITEESFDGERVRILDLSNAGGVSQEIAVPKTPGASARYTLSFLCQTLHVESGWLRIFKDEQALCAIELKPDPARHLQDDLARLAAGQPLAFEPTPYELNLDVLVVAEDTLRFEIISPKNEPADYYSKVRITRLNVQLHLDPLTLQTVQLDEQSLSADSTVYLCLGATDSQAHKLIFMPPPDNAWDGTQASLTLDGNPQEAIIITPSEDIEQLLTEHWMLDCPVLGDEDRYSLTLNLLNRYASAPYKIAVSLGHHRLKFRQTLEAAYYPILEYEQRVRLGVRVASYYTAQFLAGLTVNWSVSGQGVKSASVTDDEGWAYYDFVPAVVGEAIIEASVESRYYATGVATEQFTVRVLATDPWRDLRAVVDDGETAWDAQGYPNRGSEYELKVRVPAGSPLLKTELSLCWTGDSHAQLGVEVAPLLESPVPVDTGDVVWTLNSEDELDGKFELSLVCSKLLRPSPWKPMSLARNKVKVGDVREANKSPVVDEQESVLLRLQVLHDTAGPEEVPVSNALVDWHTPEGLIAARSGADGWASLLYTPKAAGDLQVTADIKAHPEAEAVTQAFDVHAIETSPWKQQIEILLDDVPVEFNSLGVVCRPGQSHTLNVRPRTDSQWLDRKVSLHWRHDQAPDIGLRPSDLEIGKPLAKEGVQWTLVVTAQGISSLFDLELRLEGLGVVRALPGRLLSADLNKEVSLLLDQVRIQMNDEALYPCLGAVHRFNVLPNGLSPLVGLQTRLTWQLDSPEELEATICPALDEPQVLTDGGAVWELNFSRSEQSGRFELTLELPQLKFRATRKPMVLHHNKVRIHVMREPAVDPVVNQVPAHLWVQILSHFTGRPVADVPVKWWLGANGDTVRTDDEGWSGYAFAPEKADTYTVIALVENFFDDYEDIGSIDVTALAEDPWAGLKVSFDNQVEQPWAERTFFPRRKAQHQFKVTAAANSALWGKRLALGIASGSGPAELDISFVGTSLGEPEHFSADGLTYTFTVGDLKDGGFGLCFASERLASLSPVNAMSVGEGAPAMKIVSGERVMQTLLWEEAVSEQITVISVINDKPMANVAVTWWSQDLGEVTAITNFYGVAKVRFVPTTPGAFELTARVGDTLHSDSVSWSFYLSEPREIHELYQAPDSPQSTGTPEAYAYAKVVSALTGLPLAGVEVLWDYQGQFMQSSLTGEDGIAGFAPDFSVQEHGVLSATVKGGIAGWEVKSLLYGGPMAAIESLTCDTSVTYVGYEVNAQAHVKNLADGAGWPGIQVKWSFAGQTLPDATADNEGIARSTFRPQQVGYFDLVASLARDLSSEKRFPITVEFLPIAALRDIRTDPQRVLVNSEVKLRVFVFSRGQGGFEMPLKGIQVQWKLNYAEIGHSLSNDQGWAEFDYKAGTAAGAFPLKATVFNTNGEVSAEMNLVVRWPG